MCKLVIFILLILGWCKKNFFPISVALHEKLINYFDLKYMYSYVDWTVEMHKKYLGGKSINFF